MTYANEFDPEYHPEPRMIAALEADGWTDSSWRDDVAPSWGKQNYRFMIHEPDASRREVDDPRFVIFIDGSAGGVLFASDDFDAAMKFARELK